MSHSFLLTKKERFLMEPIRTEQFLWTEGKRLVSRKPVLHSSFTESTLNIEGQLRIGSNRQAMLTHKKDLLTPKTRLGIWTEKGTSWFSTNEWDLFPGYYQKNELLVSHAYHRDLHLLITAFDRTNQFNNGFVRTLSIKNQSEQNNAFKLLIHQQTLIADREEALTFYVPEERALIHHQEHMSTLVSARFDDDIHVRYEAGSYEKNWDDQTGTTLFSPIASGSAESLIVMNAEMKPHQEIKGCMWVLHNESLQGLEDAHQSVQLDVQR